MTEPPQGRRPAPRRPSSVGRSPKTQFTGRAALVAIVLCGIALSLAYPVREYISQRKQVDQLEAQNTQIQAKRKQLQRESRQLHEPAYIEQQARDRLHMCLPTQVCYEIIGDAAPRKSTKVRAVAMPWYAKVWSSVQEANSQPQSTGQPSASHPGHAKAVPRSHASRHRNRRTHA